MKFLALLLRVYSFVFHLTLSVFLLGVAGIAYRWHDSIVSLPLPFADDVVLRDITLLGLFGLILTLLALTRRFKILFVLWTAVLFYVMIKSFFLGPFSVSGTAQIRGAAWLTFGALGALFGALWALKSTYRRAFF